MEASDIKDDESLQVWLESLPIERRDLDRYNIALEHRAAMSVLPVAWSFLIASRHKAEALNNLLIVLRAALTASIQSVYPVEKLKSKAETLARNTFRVGRQLREDSSNPFEKSAYASVNATAASALVCGTGKVAKTEVDNWGSTIDDVIALSQGVELHTIPLNQKTIQKFWPMTRANTEKLGEHWFFWIEWYENAMHGRTQNWTLLTKIALIDPKEWDKGAEHINALIHNVIAEHKRNSEIAPAPLDNATRKRVKSSVQANGPVLALQLGALLEIVDEKIERLRGANSLEQDTRASLLDALKKLKAAAKEILALLPDSGVLSDAEAEQIAGWGAVLKEQAQHWNAEAKKFISGKSSDERVVFTGRLVLASVVAGPLSLMGLGTFAAVAGGAILLKGKLDIPKAINAIRSETPSP